MAVGAGFIPLLSIQALESFGPSLILSLFLWSVVGFSGKEWVQPNLARTKGRDPETVPTQHPHPHPTAMTPDSYSCIPSGSRQQTH